jgi:ATP-binding cassette subfamily B (MDR/TAP) protein 8
VFRESIRELVKNSKNIKAPKIKSQKLPLTFVSVFSASVLVKSGISFAKCEARPNELQLVDKHKSDVKFQWKLFWNNYLKKHILKLLCSICAALAVAYLNISIPSLLGDMINLLSKYANEVHGTARDFMQDVREPAIKLILSYLAQSTFTFGYIYLLSDIGTSIKLYSSF